MVDDEQPQAGFTASPRRCYTAPMATKKKAVKPSMKTKKTAAKKATPKKSAKPIKKLAKTKLAKKPAPKPAAKKAAKKPAKKKLSARKQTRKGTPPLAPAPFSRDDDGSSSGGQAGDLQGLSHRADADSESVDELLEEGNAFEAGIVEGVEDAGDEDEKEVRTREVPEDDVPEEYLDQD
jgi:hypothetical protein